MTAGEPTHCQKLHAAARRWREGLAAYAASIREFAATGNLVAVEEVRRKLEATRDDYRELAGQSFVPNPLPSREHEPLIFVDDLTCLRELARRLGIRRLDKHLDLISSAVEGGRVTFLTVHKRPDRSLSVAGVRWPRFLQMLQLGKGVAIGDARALDVPPGVQNLMLEGVTGTQLEDLKLPPALGQLVLRDTGIASLERLWFGPRFRNLIVSGSQITDISAVAFPDGLQFVRLERSPLASIASIRWPDTLTDLGLDHADLHSIDDALFPPGLRSLALGGTDIQTITRQSWPDSLVWITLSRTPLATFEGITWPPKLATLRAEGLTQLRATGRASFPVSLHSLELQESTLLDDISGLQLHEGLRSLWLDGTRVSTLRGLTLPRSLRSLRVDFDRFDHDELDELADAYPNLSITDPKYPEPNEYEL